MTERQHQVLTFIRQHIEQHGFSPSFDEIAEATDTKSRGSVFIVVQQLVRDGHLVKDAGGRSRNLRLPGINLVAVPTADLQKELERRDVE